MQHTSVHTPVNSQPDHTQCRLGAEAEKNVAVANVARVHPHYTRMSKENLAVPSLSGSALNHVEDYGVVGAALMMVDRCNRTNQNI